MKSQAEIVLETLHHLSDRGKRLQVGGGTDEEERIERRVLMLARRLQLMEADPRPIQAPVVTPAVADKPPASDDKAEESKADKSDAEKKPEEKDDPAAKEKKEAADPDAKADTAAEKKAE